MSQLSGSMKLDALAKLGLSILAILAPIKGMVITCLILILIDLISGIAAAIKRKEKISSYGLRRTAVKLFVYESAIVLGFITEQFLLGPTIPVVSIITGFVGITELLSILENLNTISGTDLLKALLDKLHQPKL